MKTPFRIYDLAISFYRACKAVQLPGFLKTQLMRASSSVALNLSEGNGRTSIAERRQFFSIAMGSLRECQAVVDWHLPFQANIWSSSSQQETEHSKDRSPSGL